MKPIFKVLYLFYRGSAGVRHWIQRRFTKAGLTVLCALAIAAMMGLDTENNVTYQGFAVLLCLLVVALSFSVWFGARFVAERHLPRFGTVGCPLTYGVRITNLTAKPQRGLELLETLADPRPSFPEWLAVQMADEKQLRSFRFSQGRRTNPFRPALTRATPVPTLPPHRPVDVAVELRPLRRGMLRLTGLSLARPDPLGLFRSFIKIPAPESLLVLPRRYPLPPLSLPGTLKYQEGGVALASHVGQSEEFVSLRDYRHGDPLRHIHWRSWAKAGRPVVREFEDEFFVRHALVLDTFTDHPFSEAFEEAVSVAASFAYTIQTQESLLDLLFIGAESYRFTSGRGLAFADQMLEILASVKSGPPGGFVSLERLVLNHAQAVAGCICVLLDWDSPRRDFVKRLRTQGMPLLVLVIREGEDGSPLDPGPMTDEPDHFRVLQVGQIEQGLASLQ
jgi:hypothetical protein